MTAIVWGFIVFSLAVIATILGLSLKLLSEVRKAAKLQRALDGSEVEVKGLEETVTLQTGVIIRLRKGLEVLRDELDKADADLSAAGVADRLKRLLSGKVSEGGNENGEG